MKPFRLSVLMLALLVIAALLGMPGTASTAKAEPRDFTGTITNHLKTTTFTTSDAPFTISLWARADTTTAGGTILAMTDGNNGVAEDGWLLVVLSTNVLRARCIAGGTAADANPTNTVTDGAFFHVFYVETTSADRACVLNGDTANAGANTTGRNPANPIEITIGGAGVGAGTAINAPFDGVIQDVYMWDVALSTEYANRLYLGQDPKSIGPGRGHLFGWVMTSTANEPPVGSPAGPLTLTGTIGTIGGIGIRGGAR